MLAVRLRRGLPPAARRRLAAATGLALVEALRAVGEAEAVLCRWEAHPDAVHGRCREVPPAAAAEALRCGGGVTAVVRWAAGGAELRAEVDIYSDPALPRELGLLDGRADAAAHFEGYTSDGGKAESFRHLMAGEPALARRLAAAYIGRLAQEGVLAAVSSIKAPRGSSLRLRAAEPLWYAPWDEELALDLYREAPPGRRRLLGPIGFRYAVQEAGAYVLQALARHYDVTPLRPARGIFLYPRSPDAHDAAVAELTAAVERALATYDWYEHVKRFARAFMRELGG